MPFTDLTRLPFFCWVLQSTNWRIIACSEKLREAVAPGAISLLEYPLEKLIGSDGADAVRNWYADNNAAHIPLQLRTALQSENGIPCLIELRAARLEAPYEKQVFCFAIVPMAPEGPPRIDAAVADQAKLDALAIWAQGLGHEINNPLQIIMGNAEHLAAIVQDEKQLTALHEILSASQRIQAAVANLQNFVRAAKT